MEKLTESPSSTNKSATQQKLRIAFLASHNGTDMRAIIEAVYDGILDAKPVLLIANNSDAPAMQYIQSDSPIKFEAKHISTKSDGEEKTPEQVDEAIRDKLQECHADIVVLCGYMKKIGSKTLEAFEGRILNVHPALLPDLQGHWGDAIYDEVIQRRRYQPSNPNAHWTGVTIHEVDARYDTGRHVRQAAVKIRKRDTVQSLKNRVQRLEKTIYIQVLQDIASGALVLGKETTGSRR